MWMLKRTNLLRFEHCTELLPALRIRNGNAGLACEVPPEGGRCGGLLAKKRN
jgi:hypothetical protein